MAPRNDSPKGSQKELKKIEKMSKNKSLFLGRFKGLWGHGSMREALEMVTVSRIPNMVKIRKKNTCFVPLLLF